MLTCGCFGSRNKPTNWILFMKLVGWNVEQIVWLGCFCWLRWLSRIHCWSVLFARPQVQLLWNERRPSQTYHLLASIIFQERSQKQTSNHLHSYSFALCKIIALAVLWLVNRTLYPHCHFEACRPSEHQVQRTTFWLLELSLDPPMDLWSLTARMQTSWKCLSNLMFCPGVLRVTGRALAR